MVVWFCISGVVFDCGCSGLVGGLLVVWFSLVVDVVCVVVWVLDLWVLCYSS